MSAPRVAMIARAWRTPLGATVDAVMARLYAGERAAIADPRGGDGYACTVVAPIREEPATSRHARFLRRMGLHAMDVAREALVASGLPGGPRVGLFSAVGGLRAHWDDMMGAFEHQREDGELMWERGLRDVHPYWMLRHLSNNVHALASAELGLRGEGATFGGGNAGAQALGAAARALCDGALDAAVVVAHDSLLEPETLVELGARGAATQARAGDVVAPYAERANGFIPGEAAAAVVLVREADNALACLAAIDGADGASAEPSMATLARCARLSAGSPELAVVDGAARGWPELDRDERAVLAELVGAATPLAALSAAMGHLGAATALVQSIALAEALRAGTLPPIAGLTAAADGPLRPLTRATPTSGRTALGLQTAAPGLAAAIRVELAP